MRRRLATTLICAAVATTMVSSRDQERFSFFQASTTESVERMLTLAALRDDDVVVDLGSGNGLIPLTAAKMNAKLRGWGVDINPKLVEASNDAARNQGVADRIRFYHRNAFDVDLSDATVITMWLFPELMQLLRPVILERARPGTRVLTSTWSLGSWKPDESDDGAAIYLWVVPARVAGAWDWTLDIGGQRVRYSAVLEQRFQEIEGVVRTGDRREVLKDASLRGADARFALEITLPGLGLTTHEFSGNVQGEAIEGTVRVTPPSQATMTLPWRAGRVARSDYFAHTGTAMFQPPTSEK
jgi:hypothetical protein